MGSETASRASRQGSDNRGCLRVCRVLLLGRLTAQVSKRPRSQPATPASTAFSSSRVPRRGMRFCWRIRRRRFARVVGTLFFSFMRRRSHREGERGQEFANSIHTFTRQTEAIPRSALTARGLASSASGKKRNSPSASFRNSSSARRQALLPRDRINAYGRSTTILVQEDW
jgi:hypothetical protein